jgi:hypothetical protein
MPKRVGSRGDRVVPALYKPPTADVNRLLPAKAAEISDRPNSYVLAQISVGSGKVFNQG